jgi:purine-nucleoside phosphorylase
VSQAFDAVRVAITELTGELAPARPVALILGSGMAPVLDRVQSRAAVSFADVPGLVPPTVAGHKGQIIAGTWSGHPVLVFTGRLHFYEGHRWDRVVRPVEVAVELGASALVLTNASGGIAEKLGPGSLMALTNHIEWNRPEPWKNADHGDRPSPYSPSLRARIGRAATACGVELHEGVYLAVTGPCYETPAEVRAMRTAGADAVGMSTTREALRAAELGLEVAAISCVANHAAGLSGTPLSHKEVLEVVSAASGRLAQLLEEFLQT